MVADGKLSLTGGGDVAERFASADEESIADAEVVGKAGNGVQAFQLALHNTSALLCNLVEGAVLHKCNCSISSPIPFPRVTN